MTEGGELIDMTEGGELIDMTEGGELIDSYDGRELIVNEADRHAERSLGMEFESEEAAMAYYVAYAKCVGFIWVGNCHHSSRDGSIVSRRFLCNKEGFCVNNKKTKRLEVRKPREVTREGCKAIIIVRKEASGKWIVTKLETSHSHPLGIPARKGRRVTIQARSQYNFSRQDEKDEIIGELLTYLHCTNQQLAECWQQLEMVLKHVEWHTDHITKSIQNIIENVKDVEAENEER